MAKGEWYEVVVGNIGTTYTGKSRFKAQVVYNRYVGQSKRREGPAACEPVTLFDSGEPIREHAGCLEE